MPYYGSSVVPINSHTRERVVQVAQVARPTVGARWGKPANFAFAEGENNALTYEARKRSVSINFPDEPAPPPLKEVRRFDGVFNEVQYLKIAGNVPTVFAYVHAPNSIQFTNTYEMPNPRNGFMGTVTTIFNLKFTLHPEGEQVGGPP